MWHFGLLFDIKQNNSKKHHWCDRKQWLKIRAEPTAASQMAQALTKIKCINIHRCTITLENYARSSLFFLHTAFCGLLLAAAMYFHSKPKSNLTVRAHFQIDVQKVNNIGHIVVKCSQRTKKNWWCMPAKKYGWFIKINSHQRFGFFSLLFSMAIYFV